MIGAPASTGSTGCGDDRSPPPARRSQGPRRQALSRHPTESSDAMSEMQAEQRSAVVFGARNLGRAVIELLVSDGWAVTGVARSRSTLTGVSASGALALNADVTDPASVLRRARAGGRGSRWRGPRGERRRRIRGERSGPFGGGPIAEADLDGFDAWAAAPARAAFSFLSAGGWFAIAQGRAATLVQVTGGSARRAVSGRGLWAAGSFGVRAITNAAALELRRHPGRVADRRRGHPAPRRVRSRRCLPACRDLDALISEAAIAVSPDSLRGRRRRSCPATRQGSGGLPRRCP